MIKKKYLQKERLHY